MIRVGIIGTENSHALAFAKYFNLPDKQTGKTHYENIRVTCVMGDDESVKRIQEEAGVPERAQTLQDFDGRVDAMMVTSRRGSQHYEYALLFVRKGMPMFIDKPFTADPAQAEQLAQEIAAAGCPVVGGSGCKYAENLQKVKGIVEELKAKNAFMGAVLNFRVMLDSEYDGVYFYASHLIEMCLEAFGWEPQAVYAHRNGDNLTAIVEYLDYSVNLCFTSTAKVTSALVFGQEKNYYEEIDISAIYAQEAQQFALLAMQKRESAPLKQLVMPVKMIDAIWRSQKNGEKVQIS